VVAERLTSAFCVEMSEQLLKMVGIQSTPAH
jgi:hypothetical protein